MTVPVEKSEMDKYVRVWTSGAYAEHSPGEAVAPIAWGWANGIRARSLTDWGCGDGRALRWFQRKGLDAIGTDIVRVRTRAAQDDVFVAPLWAPKLDMPDSDFAFSSDVLEHLPTELVDRSLRAIRQRTLVGGWLQIATIDDQKGKELGEQLHLTIRPPAWWVEQVMSHFKVVAVETTSREVRLWLKT